LEKYIYAVTYDLHIQSDKLSMPDCHGELDTVMCIMEHAVELNDMAGGDVMTITIGRSDA
jgi:hypothetical protein